MNYQITKKHKTFNGETAFCEHLSRSTQTKMKFSYFKPHAQKIDRAIIWLSGLTCNEENFITKAGAQSHLAETSTLLICPDTSPRGLSLPGERENYDFGAGAGFYLNATSEGYKNHYRMYDYISQDLVNLIKQDFGVDMISLSGHSMGGHGALVLGLREPQTFSAVSAFAPVANPTQCPWGQKAFQGYLGDNKEDWKAYDACELLRSGHTRADTLFIDQGLSDGFLEQQLLTQNFETACAEFGQKIKLRYQEGYDHSYYFISTFIKDHLEFLVK